MLDLQLRPLGGWSPHIEAACYPKQVKRLPGEPDLSYLGALLWAEGGAEAAARLYRALAPGASPAALEALQRQDAADWDWERRAQATHEDRLADLLEQAAKRCADLLNRMDATTIAEGTSLGRLVVQLASAHERIRAARPAVKDSGADYSALSDADLETLRGILDRAAAAR